MPQDREPWWDIEERRIKESKSPKKRSSAMIIFKWLLILGFTVGFFWLLYEMGALWVLGL